MFFFATNTLEHFVKVSMTAKESFIALTPKNTFLAADYYRLRDTSLLKKKKLKLKMSSSPIKVHARAMSGVNVI